MSIEIKIPDLGIDQAEVTDILVKENNVVEKNQTLIVVEGDKASMEIPSPHDGLLLSIKVNIGDIVRMNSIIAILKIDDEKPVSQNNIISNQSEKFIEQVPEFFIHASPLIRRLARSLNIDLNKISGTGRKNRIIKQDLDDYIDNLNKKNISTAHISSEDNTNSIFDFTRFGKVETIELNKIRTISGNTLFQNWSTIPHVTQFDEVDITSLEKFRIKYNHSLNDSKNGKLTLLSFIIKAISQGLEKFPYFNSSIGLDNKTIFLKKYINIGIAINTPSGLVVPVIKQVKDKKISDIAAEIIQYSHKAYENKLSVLDIQGGCFTISNLGGIGGTHFTPIINSPEAAILGVSRAVYKPMWNGKSFIPKLILPLSLSYNHRIIDGVDGAKFISFINHLLSDIRWLLV